jgi:NAD(P)-dependent dehydrogenase (short-subunit alcohol dehydrogenase family)
LSLETWQKVLAVNLTGPFLCAREAMRIMKQQGGGRMVNVGSISAQMCRPNAAPYNATKHGLVGLTKSIALEGRDYNVVCSALHPGNVMTERRASSGSNQDQEPMMTVDELALTAVTICALPLHVNVLETIVLPTQQKYIGRG